MVQGGFQLGEMKTIPSSQPSRALKVPLMESATLPAQTAFRSPSERDNTYTHTHLWWVEEQLVKLPEALFDGKQSAQTGLAGSHFTVRPGHLHLPLQVAVKAPHASQFRPGRESKTDHCFSIQRPEAAATSSRHASQAHPREKLKSF